MDRKSDYPINPLILKRWSPRAMTGAEISDEVLFSLFEAARWAPSSYNGQPWRFLYAKRGTKHFDTYMDLLIPFNQSWCKNAAVLGVTISRKIYKGKEAVTYAYDAGAAWENLALEGTGRGLVVHGMQGFDYDKAREALKVPKEYDVLAMFAIGELAPPETLPPDLLEKELNPSGRLKVSEIIREGIFFE